MTDELATPRTISPFLSLVLSVLVFSLFQFVLWIPSSGSGTPFEGEWYVVDGISVDEVAIPWSKTVFGPSSVLVTTTLPPVNGMSLCFTHLDANAVTVTLNGIPIFQAGDHDEPSASLWNAFLVVPLPDTRTRSNILTVELTGNHRIALSRSPFFLPTGAATTRATLYNLLNSDLLFVFMGASILVGIMLIGFTGVVGEQKSNIFLLGLTCILAAVYGLEFTYRMSTGPLAFYVVAKRVFISSGYLATLLFLFAAEIHYRGEIRISRVPGILTGVSILGIFAAPNLGVLFQWLPVLNGALVVNLVIVVALTLRRMRERPLLVMAAGLLGSSIIQMTLIILFAWPMPAVLQYIVLFVAVLFGLQLLEQYREALRERAYLKKAYNRDPLTNAFNRRALAKMASGRFQWAVFIDFDKFKYYNDTYGHERGDRLLQEFVRTAESCLRRDDLVVRYGGDEFILLLAAQSRATAMEAAARVHERFRAMVDDPVVDLSYGVDHIDPRSGLNLAALDEAMYQMKGEKHPPL